MILNILADGFANFPILRCRCSFEATFLSGTFGVSVAEERSWFVSPACKGFGISRRSEPLLLEECASLREAMALSRREVTSLDGETTSSSDETTSSSD